MTFRVYKFATSSGIQINSIEKNQKSALQMRVTPYLRFCGQYSFDIDDSTVKQGDTEGTTFRSRPPTLLLGTSVTIYVSNYRVLPMRIEPVGVFIIGCFIPDNRASSSLLTRSHPLSHRERRSFLLGEGKGGRKRDDDISLSPYLWWIVRGTSRFSTLPRKSASIFREG